MDFRPIRACAGSYLYFKNKILDSIQNNQGQGKRSQPKPKAEADNTNRDLDNDYFGYHKKSNLKNVLLYIVLKKITTNAYHSEHSLFSTSHVFTSWYLNLTLLLENQVPVLCLTPTDNSVIC